MSRTRNQISDQYFDWMYNILSHNRYHPDNSFRKLLSCLHDIQFIFDIDRDENRAVDGVYLRYRFACERPEIDDVDKYIHGPCSVLEMMLALSIRCEETIMDDPSYGDRTALWFWKMIVNLGLGSMTDDIFDRQKVEDIVYIFLYRKYSPDGRGGLFAIKNCDHDLRDVEIWYQLCWYLDSLM